MESKHTQGPWSINEWAQPDSSISIGAIGTPLIARVILRDVSINEQKANARRIVGCVNALEGLNDHALVGGWSFRGIEAYAKGLEKQRNELLAVLGLIEVDKDGDGFICREAMDQVRLAISEAKSS